MDAFVETDARARLAALEAAELARAVLVDYVDATDAKDLDAMAQVFADDAVMREGNSTLTGKTAILDYFEAAFGASGAAKLHFVTNVRTVAVTPDEVTLASYFLYLATGQATPALEGWGMYRDTVQIVDGCAKIIDKQMTGSWAGSDAPNGHRAWSAALS
jgi:uncharacterized protein (TIGR02246 family)